jgi:polysaccharide pyruvyl transferase CsaB
VRVVVAAWVGSTNLGDELVLAGLLQLLRARGASVTAVSVDPAATTREHGIEAVGPAAAPAAIARADALVFGGGGLLQDETSPYNLPYHLSRVWAAQATRTPVVGLGLGAGRLDTRLGQRLVTSTFRRVPVSVRDAASADLLERLGLPRPVVAADLALGLSSVDVPAQDRLVVSLRAWSGRPGRLLPASHAATGPAPQAVLSATARALDEAAGATGLAVHLVALQGDRDGPLHAAVAAHMRSAVTTAAPTLAQLPGEIASGRAVIAMRYHAGVCAVLAGRPAVLIGYSPKVDALAGQLGAGGRLLPWSPTGPAGLPDAVEAVLGQDDAVLAARAELRERGRRHGEVLDHLG